MRKCHTFIILGVLRSVKNKTKQKTQTFCTMYVSVSFGLIPVTSSWNQNENQGDTNRLTNLIKLKCSLCYLVQPVFKI